MAHTIFLAAGGTGGHIIPSAAFGQWLSSHGEHPVWITGSRPLEREIYAAHGIVPLHLSLEGSPLGVSGWRSLKRWKDLFFAFFEARKLMKQGGAQMCVLFGGYLSFPVLLAALSLRLPVLMHEQNAVAGKVTRLAAKLGVPVACAWDECAGLPASGRKKPAAVGMPLRPIALMDKREAQKELLSEPLPDGKKLLVLLGGSLGSGGMKKLLQDLQDMIKSESYVVLCMGIKKDDRPYPEALTHEACWDMAPVYSAADVTVCRAGASTLAELAALRVPAVIVPWLKASENHQLRNAECFSRMTGAPVLREDALTPEQFLKAAQSAADASADRGSCAQLNGSEKLYEVLMSLS